MADTPPVFTKVLLAVQNNMAVQHKYSTEIYGWLVYRMLLTLCLQYQGTAISLMVSGVQDVVVQSCRVVVGVQNLADTPSLFSLPS